MFIALLDYINNIQKKTFHLILGIIKKQTPSNAIFLEMGSEYQKY